MNRYRFLAFCLCILCLFVSCGKQNSTENANSSEDAFSAEDLIVEDTIAILDANGLPIDSFFTVEGSIKNGETMGGLFHKLGASSAIQRQLLTLPKDSFDVRLIKVGRRYEAYYSVKDSALEYFVYHQSPLLTYHFCLKDSLSVRKLENTATNRLRKESVTITSSLWNALAEKHIPTQLAIDLSEVYAWTIDFFSLQEGDSVQVYFDERILSDTIVLGIGRIHAAAFNHRGKTLYAYYFDSLQTHGYFDREGNSLQKTFLKAPLNYKRISSTFSYARIHPIFHTKKAHTGVDYAAPQGTPVVALGDGVVTMKEYKGGGGNTVKIKHNSTYTTGYLHLSKYAKGLAVGKHVRQGEVIGYVGQTGHATGPHLDFRVWKNGTPVDPLKLESPSAEPLPQEYKQTFDSIVSIYKF